MRYIKVAITSDIFETAYARAKGLGPYELNFKQHLQDVDGELQAKIEGSLGEVVVEKWLADNAIGIIDDRSKHTHDYSLKDGLTIEVKTKVRASPPPITFECTIPEYTIQMQTANLYIFVSLNMVEEKNISAEKYPEASIVGVISKKKFIERARYYPKGYYEPSNKFTFKMSCYNIYIKETTSPHKFPELYREYIRESKKKLSGSEQCL